MAKPSRKTKRARPARGQVGLQTYEHVRKIVAEKKLPVGKAFAEVAKATGRKPGTVAVTYYRIARQQGGPIRKRGAGKRRGRPAKAAASVKVLAVLTRVAAAVHHGGAGTTTTAALAGAPQIVVPQFYDQPYWAQRVQELGIGRAHAPGLPTVDSLASALDEVLCQDVAVRARDVAMMMRRDGARDAAGRLVRGEFLAS